MTRTKMAKYPLYRTPFCNLKKRVNGSIPRVTIDKRDNREILYLLTSYKIILSSFSSRCPSKAQRKVEKRERKQRRKSWRRRRRRRRTFVDVVVFEVLDDIRGEAAAASLSVHTRNFLQLRLRDFAIFVRVKLLHHHIHSHTLLLRQLLVSSFTLSLLLNRSLLFGHFWGRKTTKCLDYIYPKSEIKKGWTLPL